MHFAQSAAIALATVLYGSAQVQANDVFAHFMVGIALALFFIVRRSVRVAGRKCRVVFD